MNIFKKDKFRRFISIIMAMITAVTFTSFGNKKEAETQQAEDMPVMEDTTNTSKTDLNSKLTYNYDKNTIKVKELTLKRNYVMDEINDNNTIKEDIVPNEVWNINDDSNSIDQEVTEVVMDAIKVSSTREADLIINYILERYNLDMFQFKVLLSTVYHEAAAYNYEDAYEVINTIYNRTISKRWSTYITNITPNDGTNLYAQVIAPYQFSGYLPSISGYDFMELANYCPFGDEKPFYSVIQAVTDFLVSEKRVHNYLSFKSNNSVVPDGYRFTSDGNIYHELLTEDDLINDEYSLVTWDNLGRVLTKKR